MRLLGFALSCALVSVPTSSALACTYLLCEPSRVYPASGVLPANMVKLRYRAGAGARTEGVDAGRPEPRLVRLDGPQGAVLVDREELDDSPPHLLTSAWLTPREPLPVGATFSLASDAVRCNGQMSQALETTFTIGEAQPLPTELGTLSAVRDRGVVEVSGGARCSDEIDAAYADLTLQLAVTAVPYGALFEYQLIVDGKERGPFYATPADDQVAARRVVAPCDPGYSSTGVRPGVHQVRLQGRLPDGTTLTTAELSLELSCVGEPAQPRDATVAAPTDAGLPEPRDAAVKPPYVAVEPPDAASTQRDAAPPRARDASTGAAPSAENPADAGCALSATRSGTSGLLLALALLLRRRRR